MRLKRFCVRVRRLRWSLTCYAALGKYYFFMGTTAAMMRVAKWALWSWPLTTEARKELRSKMTGAEKFQADMRAWIDNYWDMDS